MQRLRYLVGCLLVVVVGSQVHAAGAGSARHSTSPGWLGVSLAPGSRVTQIFRGTPAWRAKLRVEDTIVSINGVVTNNSKHAVEMIGSFPPNTEIELSVQRGRSTMTLKVTLADKPSDEQRLRDHLVGQRVPPAISSLTVVGGTGSLGQKARVRVIEFWATSCAPCLRSMEELSSWQSRYHKRGLQVVNVSAENKLRLLGFARQGRLAQTIAHDPGGLLTDAVTVFKTPTTLVVDQKGIVRFVKVGAADLDDIEQAFLPLLHKP